MAETGVVPTIQSPMQRKAGILPLNPIKLDDQSGSATPPPAPVSSLDPNRMPFIPSTLTSNPHGNGEPVSEQEYLHTFAMIQFVAQPALVTVLRQLLEENPSMTTQVRLLCDNAMQQMMSQHAQHQSPPQQSPQHPHHHHHHQYHGNHQHHGHHQHHIPGIRTTPMMDQQSPGANRKAGRRASGREDEHELCTVHGTLRSSKHLQFNPVLRQFECVPGFHCLESNSNVPTPTKGPRSGLASTLPPPSPNHPINHASSTGNTPSSRTANGTAKAGSRNPTPNTFLHPHTPPPELTDPADPEETRRLEALLSDLGTRN